MSVKYEKWRDLSINPFDIKFKNIRVLELVSYPPAQNDVVECISLVDNKKKNVFIKIERSRVADFKTEYNTLNILLEKSYYKKVPKVIETGTVLDKDYIVLEKVEGERLSDIFKDKNIDKNPFLIKYGSELSKIHQVPIDSFNIAKQRKINDIPSSEDYKSIPDNLNIYLEYLENNKPEIKFDTFIHGDFHYANVLWDNKEVSGVLDWEYSGIGLREQDIAWACALRPTGCFMDTLEDINLFLKGYSQFEKYDKKIFKWCLINAYLHFYLMNSNNEKYKNKLEWLLKIIYNENFELQA